MALVLVSLAGVSGVERDDLRGGLCGHDRITKMSRYQVNPSAHHCSAHPRATSGTA
jgi:hypothetical protein